VKLLKTIQNICSLYSVQDYYDYGERIGVYNVPDDNFHLYKWKSELGRYVLDGIADQLDRNSKVGLL
jgi:hypothetical protein